MPSTSAPSKTVCKNYKEMMKAFAAGSDYKRMNSLTSRKLRTINISVVCHRELAREINRANEVRHKQLSEVLRSIQDSATLVNETSKEIKTLEKHAPLSIEQDKIQITAQAIGDRIQEVADSLKSKLAEFTQKSKTEPLTKDTPKQIQHQLQPTKTIIDDTAEAQGKLRKSIADTAKAATVVLKTANVALPPLTSITLSNR